MERQNQHNPAPLTDWSWDKRKSIRYVFADIDDTMTTDGKLDAASYASLWALTGLGLHVVPVTGRPAGWCDAIARQWPVAGVIGENGALAFWEDAGRIERFFHPDADAKDSLKLASIRDEVLSVVPNSRVAGDQFARLFDLAIDFAEEEPRLTLEQAEQIKDIYVKHGATAKVSSIHVNGWFGGWDKKSMVQAFGLKRFGMEWDALNATSVYLGDSPNDEPLFESFSTSIGVANVSAFLNTMVSHPSFVTEQPGGAGFAEAIDFLLDVHRID